MKSFKFFVLIFLVNALNNMAYSQFFSTGEGAFDGRFGVTAGYTNYVLDSNVLFTKSQPGYSIGIVGTAEFSDKFELLMEINYTHHRMKFIGRSEIQAEPEEIDFKLENINVPVILNYKFLNLDDKWIFGINAGITFSLLQEYAVADSAKEAYVMDPIYLDAKYLKFDSENEKISFNTYIPMGVSTEYNNIMCSVRYNMGLSDPFRQAPFYNRAFETKAKQNYYSVAFTYFFD